MKDEFYFAAFLRKIYSVKIFARALKVKACGRVTRDAQTYDL